MTVPYVCVCCDFMSVLERPKSAICNLGRCRAWQSGQALHTHTQQYMQQPAAWRKLAGCTHLDSEAPGILRRATQQNIVACTTAGQASQG